MSTFSATIALTDLTSGLNAVLAESHTSDEVAVEMGRIIEVGTSDEVVGVGDIAVPKCVALKNLSPGTLLVGFDGSTYNQELNEGQICLVSLPSGRAEVSIVEAVQDIAGSLSGTYFDLTDASGTVRVWLDVDNASTPPATPGGGRLIEVDIAADDGDVDVAEKIRVELEADAQFSATVDDIDAHILTITDAQTGTRANVAAGTSGFTVSTLQQGAGAGGSVHVKSAGPDLSVQIAVIPA